MGKSVPAALMVPVKPPAGVRFLGGGGRGHADAVEVEVLGLDAISEDEFAAARAAVIAGFPRLAGAVVTEVQEKQGRSLDLHVLVQPHGDIDGVAGAVEATPSVGLDTKSTPMILGWSSSTMVTTQPCQLPVGEEADGEGLIVLEAGVLLSFRSGSTVLDSVGSSRTNRVRSYRVKSSWLAV